MFGEGPSPHPKAMANAPVVAQTSVWMPVCAMTRVALTQISDVVPDMLAGNQEPVPSKTAATRNTAAGRATQAYASHPRVDESAASEDDCRH